MIHLVYILIILSLLLICRFYRNMDQLSTAALARAHDLGKQEDAAAQQLLDVKEIFIKKQGDELADWKARYKGLEAAMDAQEHMAGKAEQRPFTVSWTEPEGLASQHFDDYMEAIDFRRSIPNTKQPQFKRN